MDRAPKSLSHHWNVASEPTTTDGGHHRALRQYERTNRNFEESICSENNSNLFHYSKPTAEKPDF